MNKKQLRFCIVNTFLALLVFFILQKNHLLPEGNSAFFFPGPYVKHRIFNAEQELRNDDFLFINTSYDRALTSHYQYYDKTKVPRGNIAILDREKLTSFFKRVNNNVNYKYILCNIIFDHPSPHDSILAAEMTKAKKIIIAQGKDSPNLLKEFKSIEKGSDAIDVPGGAFSKYRLFDKTDGEITKSIPLKMYEEIKGTEIQPGFFFSKLNSVSIFNDFTPEYELRKPEQATIIDLGRVLHLSDTAFQNITKNKIIVIGDFYTDYKRTIYKKKMVGPLIMVNTYLSLDKGQNKISIGLILFLLLVFFFFSYLIIIPQSKLMSTIFQIPILGSLIGGARYVVAMALISVLAYFIFGNNLNLTYMGLLLYVENIFINRKFHYKRIKSRFNLTHKK